jgi:leucyl-tRNA synthetase
MLSIPPKSQFRFDWDYVSAGYGTGAVMAVPCGDERDAFQLSLRDRRNA